MLNRRDGSYGSVLVCAVRATKGIRKEGTERLCHLRSARTNRADGRCARTLVPGHTAAACPGLMKSGFR